MFQKNLTFSRFRLQYLDNYLTEKYRIFCLDLFLKKYVVAMALQLLLTLYIHKSSKKIHDHQVNKNENIILTAYSRDH